MDAHGTPHALAENKLSVAFFSHSADFGGAERCLLDLLKPLHEEGITCTVILPRRKGSFKELLLASGIEVFEASRTWWWVFGKHRWKSINRFFRSQRVIDDEVLPFLRELNPDVIYSQTIVSPWGAYCAEKLNKPHALGVFEFGDLDHELDFIFGYENSMRLLCKKSQALFWVTNAIRDKFLTFCLPSQPMIEATIYGRIEVPPEQSTRSTPMRKVGAPFKVGIFGRITPSKGQEDLVRTALDLKNNSIDVRIYMVGSADEEYAEKIVAETKKNGTRDLFELLEHQEDPYRLMSEMDVIVSCSRNEAMGRTLPEAALLHIPIIFPDRGGPAEIFKDKLHGLAYSPGDPLQLAKNIAEIHGNYAAAQERAGRTRDYVLKKFSKENFSDKIKQGLLRLKGMKIDFPSREVSDFLFHNKQARFPVCVFSRFYHFFAQGHHGK